MMSQIQVVNIISTSHADSTWLNLMLGSHSWAFSVGKLKQSLQPRRGVCSLHGADCPVFSRFEPRSDENPFVQRARLSGKRILIVNNSRKFLPAQSASGIKSWFIHLVRDGRAVTARFLRAGSQPNMWQAARQWVHEIRRHRRLLRRVRPAPICRLQYEAIVENPPEQLKRLCRFIGIEPNKQMLCYWNRDHHFLGGNYGTLFAMLRKCDPAATLPAAPSTCTTDRESNLLWYLRIDPTRFIDER